jgi:hypothetical protein
MGVACIFAKVVRDGYCLVLPKTPSDLPQIVPMQSIARRDVNRSRLSWQWLR